MAAGLRIAVLTLATALGAGCSAERVPQSVGSRPRFSNSSPAGTSSAPPAAASTTPSPQAIGAGKLGRAVTPDPLPEGLEPGKLVRVEIPGDRSALVIHGRAGTDAALIYLHGICGNIYAVEQFAQMFSKFGTLIALFGDQRCDIPRRFRWSGYIPGIQARVEKALEVVKAARGGQLDTIRRTLIGYSQGAARAEALVQRYPNQYPRLLLAGTPVKPRVSQSGLARVVSVVGGEREPNQHMRAGVDELKAAGKKARFFELPKAAHGEYGPEGDRVLQEALDFLFAEPLEGGPSH